LRDELTRIAALEYVEPLVRSVERTARSSTSDALTTFHFNDARATLFEVLTKNRSDWLVGQLARTYARATAAMIDKYLPLAPLKSFQDPDWPADLRALIRAEAILDVVTRVAGAGENYEPSLKMLRERICLFNRLLGRGFSLMLIGLPRA
jgi:hypothetical protein